MQIRLTSVGYQPVAECVTCGQRIEPDVLLATVYDIEGAELGLICTPCRESEADTLERTIQRRVSALHQQAHTLEHLLSHDRVVVSRN